MARITDREMYDYAISRGMSPVVASAMVANAKQESSLNPGIKGDKGISVGLFQHNRSRRAGLQAFAKERGKKETDWKTQVDFAIHELNTTHKHAMRAMERAKTPEQAALAFSQKFEVPRPDMAHNDKRMAYAKDVHSRFASASSRSPSAPPMAGVGLLSPSHIGAYTTPTEAQIAAMSPQQAAPQRSKTARDMGGLPMAQPLAADMTGVRPEAVTGLRGLQNAMGRTLTINSAHRSPMLNKDKKGAKRSQHMSGKAFDISTRGMTEQEKLGLIEKASRQGFRGFGVGRNMIHVDMGPTRSWGYTRPSGGGPVPGWARETVEKAKAGAFMPTPTPRPEYTPPTAIAKAEPAPQALGFMGPVATTQALPEAQKQYAGSRVATGWTAAQTPPAPVSTSFGVMAPAGVQVVSPVQQTPQTIQPVGVPDPSKIDPGRFSMTPEKQAFTAAPRQQARPSGVPTLGQIAKDAKAIPGAVMGAARRSFDDVSNALAGRSMQGPPQYGGRGLAAVMGLQALAAQIGGPAVVQSASMPGTFIGYDPNTGFTSITNQFGATTMSKGDIQADTGGNFGGFVGGLFGGGKGKGKGKS